MCTADTRGEVLIVGRCVKAVLFSNPPFSVGSLSAWHCGFPPPQAIQLAGRPYCACWNLCSGWQGKGRGWKPGLLKWKNLRHVTGNIKWDPALRVSWSVPKRSVLARGFMTREDNALPPTGFCVMFLLVHSHSEKFLQALDLWVAQMSVLSHSLQSSFLICSVGRG